MAAKWSQNSGAAFEFEAEVELEEDEVTDQELQVEVAAVFDGVRSEVAAYSVGSTLRLGGLEKRRRDCIPILQRQKQGQKQKQLRRLLRAARE